MGDIKELLFSTTFNYDYAQWGVRIVLFLAIWGAILYLGYLFFTKVAFAKSKIHKDYQLRLNFLWSLGIAQILFVVYFFFLVKSNGVEIFKLDMNLLALVPPLLVLLGSIAIHLIYKGKYLKAVKSQSIK